MTRPPGRGPEAPSLGPDELARARLFAALGDEPALLAPPGAGEEPLRFPPLERSGAPWPARRPGGARLAAALRRAKRLLLGARRLVRDATLPAQIGFAGVLAYLVLFNFSVVRGSSMAPGIRDGDRILIDQLSYLFRDVQRGDVVVLRYPLDPSVDYVKRVVGLPGDDVTIRAGAVFVNGERLVEPYVSDPDPRAFLTTIVRPSHYFVLGDNRPHSADSREFGQVPRDYLRGKVDLRVWPFQRVGLIN